MNKKMRVIQMNAFVMLLTNLAHGYVRDKPATQAALHIKDSLSMQQWMLLPASMGAIVMTFIPHIE
jgi:hypothetical protein